MALHTIIRGLSLCAGIGGIDLGLKLAMGQKYRTVCYVEREAYAAATLVARIQDGTLCDAPIWSDVATFDPAPWRGRVDLISGGYPCQPFSAAGRRQGDRDPRHLWPYIRRIVAVIRPIYCFFENVDGHVSLGLEAVATDLCAMGYRVSAGIFSAAECGAPHIRKRLFVLANTQHGQRRASHSVKRKVVGQKHGLPGRREQNSGRIGGIGQDVADSHSQRGCQGKPESTLHFGWRDADGGGSSMADTHSARCGARSEQSGQTLWDQARRPQPQRRSGGSRGTTYWSLEPAVGRLAHGVPNRVDRVRALGNAVVPTVAAKAFLTLSGDFHA